MTINLSHSRPALSAAAFSSGMYCSGRLLALQHGRYAGAQCLIGGSRSTATWGMIVATATWSSPAHIIAAGNKKISTDIQRTTRKPRKKGAPCVDCGAAVPHPRVVLPLIVDEHILIRLGGQHKPAAGVAHGG